MRGYLRRQEHGIQLDGVYSARRSSLEGKTPDAVHQAPVLHRPLLTQAVQRASHLLRRRLSPVLRPACEAWLSLLLASIMRLGSVERARSSVVLVLLMSERRRVRKPHFGLLSLIAIMAKPLHLCRSLECSYAALLCLPNALPGSKTNRFSIAYRKVLPVLLSRVRASNGSMSAFAACHCDRSSHWLPSPAFRLLAVLSTDTGTDTAT